MQMSSLSMSSAFSDATDQAQKPLSHDSSGSRTETAADRIAVEDALPQMTNGPWLTRSRGRGRDGPSL
jgi:hypothetical protein